MDLLLLEVILERLLWYCDRLRLEIHACPDYLENFDRYMTIWFAYHFLFAHTIVVDFRTLSSHCHVHVTCLPPF